MCDLEDIGAPSILSGIRNVSSFVRMLPTFDLPMSRHGTSSRRPAKEQSPDDMRDDKTTIVTVDHNNIPPLPPLTPSTPCPDSDRCDTAGVPVPPSRRSAPVISRFHPVLGWRTILQILACRTAESTAFSVPNASWSRAEDDLLVQAVAKCSTSNILGRDWIEVAWEMSGCH